ncbi:alpha/beta hydrolase [Undibacterium sp.]|jgi:pimeloyl-ACP methyl ester carboxylesterase|uniref:alpha/beta fold hydrolase n=1 Tax=Undibacterium sp. TaxID=1914977 RepID=UPI002C2A82D7|nr:alpha/beta hydrolase [Undibacterium sp.]HTD03659.1 alpha/beta hydrolase [Undibacterium sp.]
MGKTAIVMVPCFAGAPWTLSQFSPLSEYNLKTMKLPDDLRDIEAFADFLEQQVRELDSYILVGDSFGAVISLAFATRQPKGLKALVISGGFAKNPITSTFLKFLSLLVPYFPGIFYRELTLRIHAFNLRSRFDKAGEIPWSQKKTLDFFKSWTPHKAYVNRVRAVEKADYVTNLKNILVPTLILTPEEDNLIGSDASRLMLKNISTAIEEVLPSTGHMFRFSHPRLFSDHIKSFLQANQIQ